MAELWSDDNTLEAQEGWREYRNQCIWKWTKRILKGLGWFALYLTAIVLIMIVVGKLMGL